MALCEKIAPLSSYWIPVPSSLAVSLNDLPQHVPGTLSPPMLFPFHLKR